MSIDNIDGWLLGHLRCPDCQAEGISRKDDLLVCPKCSSTFWVRSGKPVMLRSDNAIFPASAYDDHVPSPKSVVSGNLSRFVPRISVNLSSKRCLKIFCSKLGSVERAYILVVGGGKQRRWMDEVFRAYPNISLFYCDIDKSALLDLFCDAHDLPFVDGCFDGVITTAVLQHVIDPRRSASEIWRVLKCGGLLYSEMAFMQQVIEGAYDFTRYTHAGHRRLFNRFSEIDSGLVAGPATALVWAIENFVLSFARSRSMRTLLKMLIRYSFFWIKYLDYLMSTKPQAYDAASCTYFLGEKIDSTVPDQQIVSGYVGAKHLNHQ